MMMMAVVAWIVVVAVTVAMVVILMIVVVVSRIVIDVGIIVVVVVMTEICPWPCPSARGHVLLLLLLLLLRLMGHAGKRAKLASVPRTNSMIEQRLGWTCQSGSLTQLIHKSRRPSHTSRPASSTKWESRARPVRWTDVEYSLRRPRGM